MFESDPKKRKRFDRTSHKLSSYWPELRHKHKRLFFITVVSILIGAIFFALVFGDTPMTGGNYGAEDMVLWSLIGAGIPFILLVPLLCISYKNSIYMCSSEATHRYGDTLEFQKKQAVYR